MEADKETTKVMLQSAGKTSVGYLIPEDIKKIPCEDLRSINQLWLHYSKGKFGFSVQKEIYESLGGTKIYVNYFNKKEKEELWENFGYRVGWRKGGMWVGVNYSNLTFNVRLAPRGYLPISCLDRSIMGWGLQVGTELYFSLMQRLISSKI